MVGYLIYEIQERPASALKHASRLGFLHQIAVDKNHRRQGIGSKLINEMKRQLRTEGINALYSEYFAFNTASAALMRSAKLKPQRIRVSGNI